MATDNTTVPDSGFVESSPGRLSNAEYKVLASYLLIVGLGATVLNVTSLLLFSRNKKLRSKSHNLLLMSLAASDLGISVFGYPFTIAASFHRRWVFGIVGCYVQGFFTFFLSLCSMYTLTAISVYRYIALCKPEKTYKLNKSFTVKLMAVMWAVSFTVPMLPLLGWTDYRLEPYGTGCSIDWTSRHIDNIVYIIFCIALCYATTVPVMAFSYWKMVQRHLVIQRAIRSARNQVFSLGEARRIHNVVSENKVMWVTLAMVLSFVILWSPYALIGLWASLSGTTTPKMLSLPSVMAKTSPFLNPLIYIFLSPELRKNIPAIFKRHIRVHALNHHMASSGDRNVFHVDRTNDGIYVGTVAIQFNGTDTTMF